ncbi:hypothetical protein DB931_24295 [Salmonella enterica]|nr:hypothetical protein [Salmonella enterica]
MIESLFIANNAPKAKQDGNIYASLFLSVMKFNPLISVNGIIIIDRQIIFDNNLFLNPVNMKIARTTEYAETSIDIVHKEPFNEPPSLFPENTPLIKYCVSKNNECDM